ncbi:unnamed protein product, partial [Ectocarpus sp. 6 AP-2014]
TERQGSGDSGAYINMSATCVKYACKSPWRLRCWTVSGSGAEHLPKNWCLLLICGSPSLQQEEKGRRGLRPKRIGRTLDWIQAASPHPVQARSPIPLLPQQGAPHINPNPLTAVTSTNSRRTNPRRPLLMTRASPGSTAQIESDCRHGEYGHTSRPVWQKNTLAYASKADRWLCLQV